MIERYLEELDAELGAVGIRGRLRQRILVECEDHLRTDPAALQRFGSAREIAGRFASELGARASRRAAVGAFAALGVAGLAYAISFASASFAGRSAPDTWPVLAQLAFAVGIVAPQVSFVAGSLALVRALRRREAALPSSELAVINRRTGVALVFGLATMAAVAVFALDVDSAHWWVVLTLAGVAVATPLLLLALVPAVGASRIRPQVAGVAGDVFDDLRLVRYRDDPWRFARRVAFGAGLLVFLAAAVRGDPFDGALNGLAEALACLGGFAVFGRYLALRR